MPSYSGPIYFEAVPCSSSCNRCPSALASSSRFPTCTHAASVGISPSLAEEQEEFEWSRLDSVTTKIDVAQSTRTSRHASSASASASPMHMNDVQRPFRPDSRSFDLLPASTHAPALAYPYRSDEEGAEMTPVNYSRNARTASLRRPGKIRDRSASSRVSLSSAFGFDATSSRADSIASIPFATSSLPAIGRVGGDGSTSSRHAQSARNSIWSWVSGVDPGQQQNPLLHRSAPLRSDSLQVPCDVDMDRDLYSPRTVPSSLHSHLSAAAAEMSAPSSSSSRSSPLPTDRRTRGFDSTSFTSDRVSEGGSLGGGLNGWQHVMDEAAAPSFLAFSPCPSSCSSTMGFTSTLPREPATLDETTYRSLLDKWTESEEWKEEVDRDGEGSTSGFETHYNVDAYPRSAASSPHFSDVEMHPAVLPALLDQHDFSTLMLQSFRLALAEAKLLEGDGFEGFNAAAEGPVEDDRASIASFPSHLQDFDRMDQWSPPALRSSSSASSLDPFHLELFSPQSEQTDPAAVWEAHRTPGDSSDSREYFSSSPFVGWSSSSDADAKPALLTLNAIPPPPPLPLPSISSVPAPLAEVPLYQPQPIRPICPIDIAANLVNELAEGSC